MAYNKQDLPTVDGSTLRAWAELSDGERDNDLFITVDPSGTARIDPPTAQWGVGSDPAPSTAVIRVRTASNDSKRKKAAVSVRLDGTTQEVALPPDTDALFWTESAIEKFCWPYYGSMRIYADEIAQLKQAYYYGANKDRIIAVAHVPPSHSSGVEAPDPGIHVGLVDPEDKTNQLRFEPLAEALHILRR